MRQVTQRQVRTGFLSVLTAAGCLAAVPASASAAGQVQLAAVFLPATASYRSAMDAGVEVLTPGAPVPLMFSEPQSGAFSITISPGTVTMTVSGATATGALLDITVTDSRDSQPGWLISGQASAFAGAGTATGWSIPGSQLGWTPTAVGGLHDGATLGRTVAPAKPGLGITTAAATLAEAPPGYGSGTNVLSANLTLAIPPGTVPGPYAGAMTITYFVVGPQQQG